MFDVQSSVIHARYALRLGLGFIWVYEGLVPKLLVPLTGFEKDVVAASGLVPNGIVEPFLYVLGALEIALGLLVLSGLWLRTLCVIQAVIVSFFTLVIPLTSSSVLTVLTHPFGLLSKNVPIVAAIIALWFLERAGNSIDAALSVQRFER